MYSDTDLKGLWLYQHPQQEKILGKPSGQSKIKFPPANPVQATSGKHSLYKMPNSTLVFLQMRVQALQTPDPLQLYQQMSTAETQPSLPPKQLGENKSQKMLTHQISQAFCGGSEG